MPKGNHPDSAHPANTAAVPHLGTLSRQNAISRPPPPPKGNHAGSPATSDPGPLAPPAPLTPLTPLTPVSAITSIPVIGDRVKPSFECARPLAGVVVYAAREPGNADSTQPEANPEAPTTPVRKCVHFYGVDSSFHKTSPFYFLHFPHSPTARRPGAEILQELRRSIRP